MPVSTADTPISQVGDKLTEYQFEMLQSVTDGHVTSVADSDDATIKVQTYNRGLRSANPTMRALRGAGLVERRGLKWVLTPAGHYVLLRRGGA